MRMIFAATAAALLAACGQVSVPASERAAVSAPSTDTRVLAVLSYADWCGSCKALDPKVKAVLINIFGGITRGDEVAKGILEAIEEVKPTVPMVVRLVGTNAEEGRALLADADMLTAETLVEAAQKAVAAAKEA